MHLKQSKYKNGRTYISIVESYRGEDKKPRVRTVKTFGYLDELEITYGKNALEKCKAICDEMTREAKGNKKANLEISLEQNINDLSDNRKNVGSAVITRMINNLLLDRPIKI